MSIFNWDSIRHFHSIEAVSKMLGQLHGAEFFIIDSKGQVLNHVEGTLARDSVNPLCKLLCSKKPGGEALWKSLHNANEELAMGGRDSIVVPGPFGIGQAVVGRILMGEDFLGSVYVAFFAGDAAADREGVKKLVAALGIDPAAAEKAVAASKPLPRGESADSVKCLTDVIVGEVIGSVQKEQTQVAAASGAVSYDNIIGPSKKMQDMFAMLRKLHTSDSTVLIQGENGTGKEMVAKAIHRNSQRKDNAFITVNCSAFNENLLDSELFGHIRGSFTGAIKDKKGLFEAAHNGTLFLDEIGDMSPTMQVKLLRVLQEGTFTPVGSTEMRKADVRVLAATNRNLKEMIENGQFREDLYYRVNVINVHVPALRERKEDIPHLLSFFLDRECREKGLKKKELNAQVVNKLEKYPWPGNIRELENEVERLVVLSGDDQRIGEEMLSPKIRDLSKAQEDHKGLRVDGSLKEALEQLEKTMILEGLRRTGFNKSRLAKELGISRAGLIMKVEKYGLDKRKLARSG